MATKTLKRKPRSSSKAQAVRDEFAAQGPNARPKDVISALKARGISVSSAQVSNIKATLGNHKPGRNGHSTNGSPSFKSLVEAKKFADRMGGVRAALHAIEALAKLT